MNKNIVLGGIVSALFIAGAIFAFSSGSGRVEAEERGNNAKAATCSCQGGPEKCGQGCSCGCQNKGAQAGSQSGCGCGR